MINIASNDLIAEFKISKFPTLLVIKGNQKGDQNVEVYEGKFEIQQLKDFIKDFALKEKITLQNRQKVKANIESETVVQKLTSKNFTEEVQKIEQLVMIHLYENEEFPLFNETITKFQY